MGCKEEASEFAKYAEAKGWQVLSIDLPGHGERKQEIERFSPWFIVPELRKIIEYMKQNWTELSLHAGSIGAYFAMLSFTGDEFDKAMMISPLLDMRQLIENMMTWAGVTKEQIEFLESWEKNKSFY